MSEHDDPTEERELYEEVPPRSIFAATWFRVLLVVIVIGVIGAVAIPYVLDFMNPPPTRPTTAAKPPAPAVAIPATSSAGSPGADKPSDRAETPAPAPSVTAAPTDTKPAPPSARSTETKPAAPKSESKTAAASEKKTAMAVTESTPPKAMTPPAKPTPASKSDTAAKSDTGKSDTAKSDTPAKDPAPKTDAIAKAETKPDTVAKAEARADTAKTDAVKPATATKPAATPKRAAVAATTTVAKPPTASGPFWVQVGAFKDADIAKKVAAKLREDNFSVEESVTRTGGAPAKPASPPAATAPAAPAAKPDLASDQYDVFVSGQTPEELNKRLAAKGLAAESSSGGMVVKPSLPLRDAVALSKDLAVEGFKVQVRRAGGSMGAATAAAPAPAPSAPATSDGGTELHRVRVGGFADRTAALEAVKQLEAKGYKPYIARGAQ